MRWGSEWRLFRFLGSEKGSGKIDTRKFIWYHDPVETVAIPQKLKKTVRGAARNLGVSENDLMTNAVLYYLAAVKKSAVLKDELRMWDEASAADLVAFERSLA